VFVTNTLFWSLLLLPVTLLKLALPFEFSRRFLGNVAAGIAGCWVYVNSLGIKLSKRVEVEVIGDDKLKPDDWYLVVSNHQSWADIPILQMVFRKKIPMLKFFLKKELIWVPVLGPAWWALDFPFMKRYSKEHLRKYPQLKGKDMEITRKACEKFKKTPTAVMTFAEATRFSEEKRNRQGGQLSHVLRPRAGSVGFVLSAMGDQLSYILDVTICYPLGVQELWGFLCGKIEKVIVKIDRIPIRNDLIGNYTLDQEYKKHLQQWLNDRWTEKERFLESRQKTPST
jgi:1-acyl-sn-glycerol-3-phosphate acyltransferase